MSETVTCPGKTFLVGEYLALEGGPSLLACTGPFFKMTVSPAASRLRDHVNQPVLDPRSPAGKLLYRSGFGDFAGLRFHDPHVGRGGLGASTGQYLLARIFLLTGERSAPSREGFHEVLGWMKQNWLEELILYRDLAFNGQGRRPSGHDLLGQLFGGVCHIDEESQQINSSHSWPFSDIKFHLFRTGMKVPTHLHLTENFTIPQEPLNQAALATIKAFQGGIGSAFENGISDYAGVLERAGLVDESVLALLERVRRHEQVRVAKPCGARGADILLVLTDAHVESAALSAEIGLELCGSSESLAAGVATRGQLSGQLAGQFADESLAHFSEGPQL